ncbi:MAG TPA: hypothetical protein VGQ06_06910 [Gemmatimonadales bacterium]|jgi:hypothetical protein|nr:hypothetical protein [Gemmatimonadales bacterium]
MSDEIFTRLRSLLKAYAELKESGAPGPRTGGAGDRKRQTGAEALRKVVRPVLDAFMAELKNVGHDASTRDHTERADAYPSVALSFTPRGGLASALMFKYDPKRGIVVQREIKSAPAQGRVVTGHGDRTGTIGVDAVSPSWVETKTLAFVADVLKAN